VIGKFPPLPLFVSKRSLRERWERWQYKSLAKRLRYTQNCKQHIEGARRKIDTDPLFAFFFSPD